MGERVKFSRRGLLKGIGAYGGLSFFGKKVAVGAEQIVGGNSSVIKDIREKVFATKFIDTHEHLQQSHYPLGSWVCIPQILIYHIQ